MQQQFWHPQPYVGIEPEHFKHTQEMSLATEMTDNDLDKQITGT